MQYIQCTNEKQTVLLLKNSLHFTDATDAILLHLVFPTVSKQFQCFDTVGWAAGRASGL